MLRGAGTQPARPGLDPPSRGSRVTWETLENSGRPQFSHLRIGACSQEALSGLPGSGGRSWCGDQRLVRSSPGLSGGPAAQGGAARKGTRRSRRAVPRSHYGGLVGRLPEIWLHASAQLSGVAGWARGRRTDPADPG